MSKGKWFYASRHACPTCSMPCTCPGGQEVCVHVCQPAAKPKPMAPPVGLLKLTQQVEAELEDAIRNNQPERRWILSGKLAALVGKEIAAQVEAEIEAEFSAGSEPTASKTEAEIKKRWPEAERVD